MKVLQATAPTRLLALGDTARALWLGVLVCIMGGSAIAHSSPRVSHADHQQSTTSSAAEIDPSLPNRAPGSTQTETNDRTKAETKDQNNPSRLKAVRTPKSTTSRRSTAPQKLPAQLPALPLDKLTELEADLTERARLRPEDAAAQRMLGRIRMQQQNWEGALESLQRSVELDDRSAAAQLDYGRVLQQFDRNREAADALQRSIALAPDTTYASDAAKELALLAEQGGIELASYEIRTFDGSNVLRDLPVAEETFWDELQDDFKVHLELGSQYNDNVSLAPSSRELQSSPSDSAQLNASFLVQWYAFELGDFRFGPSFDSDFTLNEGQIDRLNLQSYRPGLFLDGKLVRDSFDLRPRVAYTFTHDEFHGRTFGNRHTVSSSLGSVWQPGEITTVYHSFDWNNVANDGAVPAVSSQDGVSNSIGILHDHVDKESMIRRLRIGGDYSYTNTDGSNFRYHGFSLNTQQTFALMPKLHLTFKEGWAYRNYFDFSLTPSRDTQIFRVSTELKQYLPGGFSTAIFAGYDRFVSRNDQFDTNRFQSGAIVAWDF